jgi:phosphoribosylformylglycinamidine synthase
LKTEQNNTRFTSELSNGELIRVPIAHGEGNYIASEEVLADLEANNQVIFRYATRGGEITKEANPNGALNNIAGIISREGNVLGMMPHPERACESILGSADGLKIFKSLQHHFDAVTA